MNPAWGGDLPLEAAQPLVRGRLPAAAKPAKGWRLYGRALRVGHWPKNLLVFVPLILSNRVPDAAVLLRMLLAFAAFSFCASAVYVINDLADLENDRLHAEKKNRPFAAGELSPAWGRVAVPACLAAAVFWAAFLPPGFLPLLAAYFGMTLAYTFFLKRILLVDVVMLAFLYVMRILAGGVAARIVVSSWLITFAGFFFMSLALAKRFSALQAVAKEQGRALRGRGYLLADLAQLANLGTGCGLVSVLVLALYISSPEVTLLYSRPRVLWLACPIVLYWIGRIWLITQRGFLTEDPIVFALRDPESYLAGGLVALILAGAS